MQAQLLDVNELNQKIQMFFKREKLRTEGTEGLNTVIEDLDEFDNIIAQIGMRVSIEPQSEGKLLYLDKIKQIYKQRAQKKEFPAISMQYYCQMAVATRDYDTLDDLVKYGFRTLFYKLGWSDKVYLYDLSIKFQFPNVKEYTELMKLCFLHADYESDIFYGLVHESTGIVK